MLTIQECRKITNEFKIELSNEEILKMRDWLYHTVDIAIEIIEQKTANTIFNQTKLETHEKNSNHLHKSIH